MVGATVRNLNLEMFNELTPGQIVDYCIEYNNIMYDNENIERDANQNDFDRF